MIIGREIWIEDWAGADVRRLPELAVRPEPTGEEVKAALVAAHLIAAEEQAILQIVAEIAGQQARIAANQKAIDEKIAAIEENVRVARIFVSRGGGQKK